MNSIFETREILFWSNVSVREEVILTTGGRRIVKGDCWELGFRLSIRVQNDQAKLVGNDMLVKCAGLKPQRVSTSHGLRKGQVVRIKLRKGPKDFLTGSGTVFKTEKDAVILVVNSASRSQIEDRQRP